MNVEPEQRAALLGEYIAEHSATVRAAARAFGCSKSTVHKDALYMLHLWHNLLLFHELCGYLPAPALQSPY